MDNDKMHVLSKDSFGRLKWCLYDPKISEILFKFTNQQIITPTKCSTSFCVYIQQYTV